MSSYSLSNDLMFVKWFLTLQETKTHLVNSEKEFKNLQDEVQSKYKTINDQKITLDRHVICSIYAILCCQMLVLYRYNLLKLLDWFVVLILFQTLLASGLVEHPADSLVQRMVNTLSRWIRVLIASCGAITSSELRMIMYILVFITSYILTRSNN